MSIIQEVKKINEELIPKMRGMAGELVEFQGHIENKDFYDDLEETILGFSSAIEVTNDSFKEMIDSSASEEHIQESFEIILGAMRGALDTNIDIFDTWYDADENYSLKHKDEALIEEKTEVFINKLTEFIEYIDDLGERHGLNLELPSEVLEQAWQEMQFDNIHSTIQLSYQLLDKLIEDKQGKESVNAYLDLRTELSQLENAISEDDSADKFIQHSASILALLTEIQIQQLIELKQNIITADWANQQGGELLADQFEKAEGINEDIGNLINAMQQTIQSPFNNDDDWDDDEDSEDWDEDE